MSLYELYCKSRKVRDRYLGYTTELESCLEHHAEKADLSVTSKLYSTIAETGGWSNWSVRVLETFPNRKEALARKMELLQSDDGETYTLNTHVKSHKPVYRVMKDGSQRML